jgi:hypothetical protein
LRNYFFYPHLLNMDNMDTKTLSFFVYLKGIYLRVLKYIFRIT